MATTRTFQIVTKTGAITIPVGSGFANRKAAAAAAASLRVSPQISGQAVRPVAVQVITKQASSPAPSSKGK